jgi:hypothetical protein
LRRDIVDSDGVARDSLIYALIPEEYEAVRKTW